MSSSPVNNNSGNTKSKKHIIAILVVVLLISVAGFSFMLGKMSAEVTPSEQIPSRSLTKNETNNDNLEIKNPATPAPTGVNSENTIPDKTKIITGMAFLDGYRSSNDSGNNSQEIKVGRNNSYVSRGFVSFDISEMPFNAKIVEARLKIYQAKVIGNPYTAGKQLKIDHLTFGDNLDSSDYGMAALTSSTSTLGRENNLSEWKEADVTNSVKNDLANARSTSQYRLHLQTEVTGGSAEGDFIYFESADNSLKTGNTPELIIKYQ